MIYQPIPVKRCTKCGFWYAATLDNFAFEARVRTKLTACCVVCNRARIRQCKHKTYWSDPERYREESRNRRQANPEAFRERTRKWRQQYPERARSARRHWEQAHPDKKREHDRRYYQKHHAEIRHRQQKATATKPGYSSENVRRWRKNNRDRDRLLAHRRRAKSRELPTTFEEGHWKQAVDFFHGVCAYCGQPPRLWDDPPVLHQDHFIPQAKNGGYEPRNILPACPSCNLSKHDEDPKVWLVRKFGLRRAKQILKRIQEYFELVE